MHSISCFSVYRPGTRLALIALIIRHLAIRPGKERGYGTISLVDINQDSMALLPTCAPADSTNQCTLFTL